MKSAEIREMTTKDLTAKIDETKAELKKMQLEHHINPLENPTKIRKSRRTVARLLTELRERELKEQTTKK